MSFSAALKDSPSQRLMARIATMPDVSLREAIEQAALEDPVIWCALNRRLRGHPMIFDNERALQPEALKEAKARAKTPQAYDQDRKARLQRHRPFLVEPLGDTHPHKGLMKGRQIGGSENMMNEEVAFLASNPGTIGIHTFPRDLQLTQFTSTRLDPAFEETSRMRSLLGTPNQAHAKRISDSFLLLRSAWESNLGEGVNADMVVLDEKDRMRPGVENAFTECLSSSPYGYLRELSTPTIPGRGIHATWLNSDQRVWLVRCTRCNLEQEVLYPDNFLQLKEVRLGTKELPDGAYEYACRLEKCRGTLNRMRGRWIAKRPDILRVRGYHMSQLIAPWISATEVMQKQLSTRWRQLWVNYVLGLPSMGDDILLSEADYENACAGHQLMDRRTDEWQDISVGIDWGHLNWVTVSGRHRDNGLRYLIGAAIFEDDHKEELNSVKAIDRYIAPFEPDIIMADAGYGKDRNAYLLRKYGEGVFYSVFYNPSPKASRTVEPVWSNEENARVLVDKTLTLKVTCRAIKEGQIGMPSWDEHPMELVKEHFKNLVLLRIDENEDGNVTEEMSAKGDDHFAHSVAYGLLGAEKLDKSSNFSFSFIG